MKKVLITGASGLLGRAVSKVFMNEPSWEVIGLAFSRATGNLRKCDLTDTQELKKVFKEVKPDVVVHCAAERRPDVVENKYGQAWKLNVSATENLCQIAVECGAWVLYISTDYVFDGKSPPYTPEATPNPLNKYGRSKVEGEQITLKTNPEFGVLRVPILYGEINALKESAVTILFGPVMDTEKTCVMSDYEKRYPTHCDDVAHVILKLAEARLQDSSVKGIYHWSGAEEMTKYGMAVVMAKAFGLPTDHIKGDSQSSADNIRPYNAKLDCSRIEVMGIGSRRSFNDGIKDVLSPYFKKE